MDIQTLNETQRQRMSEEVLECIRGLASIGLLGLTESAVYYRVPPGIVICLGRIAKFDLPIQIPNEDHSSVPPADLVLVANFKLALETIWVIEEPHRQAVRPYGKSLIEIVMQAINHDYKKEQLESMKFEPNRPENL